MNKTIVVLGATGLFGGHLAAQLARRDDLSLVVAGRRRAPLEVLASRLGAQVELLDREDAPALHDCLHSLRPFAVVDCSGPFQYYGSAPYSFAEAVLASGAHYLDIADDPAFVSGFAGLDELAKVQNLCAWSGASTTPALTSAIANDLVQGLSQVELIETSILPGNKTRRGLSVMRAILGQVGARFSLRYGGREEPAYGWTRTVRVAPRVKGQALSARRAALVNTADAALLARAFGARSVIARAGLELGVFHQTLSVAAFFRRHLRAPSLAALAGPLLKVSNVFAGFGSDAGGMRVRVLGRAGEVIEERVWDMILPDGQGPKTPVQPVLILLDQLLKGTPLPGARPALSAFTRAEAEAQLRQIGAVFERRDRPLLPIFEQTLGEDFATLPAPVQRLHRPAGVARHTGTARIETATTFMGKIAAIAGGFPLSGGAVDAEVTIETQGRAETWTRKMGQKTFRSTLRCADTGQMTERFGPMLFDLKLAVKDRRLIFPVGRGRAFGVLPIPAWLTPISETSEGVDSQGRFTFDVRLSLPNGALIVHYKGHLEPQ